MEIGDIIKWSSDEFKWDLKHFSQLLQRHTAENQHPCLSSPKFSTVSEGDEYKWNLTIYPNGDEKESEGSVEGFLKLLSDKSCTVAFHLIIGQKGKIREYKGMLPSVKFESGSKKWGTFIIKQNLLLEKANSLLSNDTLSIFCRIIHDDTDFQLKDDLESLITNNSSFSDIKFILNNEQKLDAHKNILATRSNVFAAMFEHNMKEEQSNEVRIEDIDYEVMKEVLRFIYCGRVTNLDKCCKELLKAAEKYDLKGLKNICEKNLCETLKVDDAIECLVLASIFNANILKEFVTDFIASHGKEIVEKPELVNELANLPKNNFPDIVISLILQCAKSKN